MLKNKVSIDSHISIKNYPEEIRPREKLLLSGAEALSDQELLAILIRTGTNKMSALELAQKLLVEGGISSLEKLSVEELSSFKGMGLAKTAQLKAAIEIGKRLAKYSLGPRPVIKCPQDVGKILVAEMSYLDKEYFKIVNLNTKNQVISMDTVSVGSLNASLVHPREVFKLSLKRNAASVIMAHNHPSGDTEPSKEDINITKRLCEAGNILGVEVLDHIIIGHNNFLSMKEKGYF